MSVRVMSMVWDRTDLSQSETLVALALADHADDEGQCWPSIDRIAEKARLKRRATQSVIKKLEVLGLLSVDRSETGRGHTSRYQFAVKGAANAPIAEERVQPGARKGAVATAPEPSVTISKKKKRRVASLDWCAIPNLNLVAWNDWLGFRKVEGMPAYKTLRTATQLARYPPDIQRAAIDHSMDNRYQGLFPDKVNGTGRQSSKPSTLEKAERATGGGF